VIVKLVLLVATLIVAFCAVRAWLALVEPWGDE
jgi:hypothetical protein